LKPHELIAKVTDWSQHDDRVIAAGICGSRARGEARPDSDIDFCILTANPHQLLDDVSWVFEFGSDARVAGDVEDYKLVQSIRVWYGTTEAEFGITDEAWAQLPIDAETVSVINDGLQILYDPDERLARAVAWAAKEPRRTLITKD
jgi:predicted nucleotidyltransferase